MYEKLSLALSGAAFAMSATMLAVIWRSLSRAVKSLRPEPRVARGELAFDHPKRELAVKMPSGVTRYVCSDGTMRDDHPTRGVSIDTPMAGRANPAVTAKVIPLFGGE
jgi:hypothetical protein